MGGYSGVLPFFTAQLSWDYPTPVAAGSLIPQPGQQFPPYDLNLLYGGGGGTTDNFPVGFPDVLQFWVLPSMVGGLTMNLNAREWDTPSLSIFTKGELDLYIRSFTITGSPSPSVSFSVTKSEAAVGTPTSLTANTVNQQFITTFRSTFNETGITDRLGLRVNLNTAVTGGTLQAQARIRLTQSPLIQPGTNVGPAIGRASRRQWFVVNLEQAIPVGAGTVTLRLYVNGTPFDVLGVFTSATTVGVQPTIETLVDIGSVDRWTVLVTATNPGFDVQFVVCAMFFPD